MNKDTQLRTLGALLMLVLVVVLNTAMQFLGYYGPGRALPIYGVAVLAVVVALRYQRLSPALTAALLFVPVALMILGGFGG